MRHKDLYWFGARRVLIPSPLSLLLILMFMSSVTGAVTPIYAIAMCGGSAHFPLGRGMIPIYIDRGIMVTTEAIGIADCIPSWLQEIHPILSYAGEMLADNRRVPPAGAPAKSSWASSRDFDNSMGWMHGQ